MRAINDRNLRSAIEFVKLCESYKVIRTPPRRKPTAVRMLNELHDRYDQPADSSVGGFLIVPGMATDLEAFAKEAEEQQRHFREARDNYPEAGDPAPVDRKGPSNRS